MSVLSVLNKLLNTVKPVLRDCSRAPKNVVSCDRWSLNTVNYSDKCDFGGLKGQSLINRGGLKDRVNKHLQGLMSLLLNT